MSSPKNLLLLTLTVMSTLTFLTTSTALSPTKTRVEHGLLGSKNGLTDCWNAMSELQSCTNEIVLFLLNGDSYLTIDCCKAIRVITKNCWPAMLSTVDFTSEEADILKDYCGDQPASPPTQVASDMNV